MRKKAHKLSEDQLLSELELTAHLPPPEFPEIKPASTYVRLPSDVGEFVMLYGLIPTDLSDAELILCSTLYDFYRTYYGKDKMMKKNIVRFGRDVAKCGLIHVRRWLDGERHYFYVIHKDNRLKKFVETQPEADSEKKQRKAIYRIQRKKWEYLPRFKKSAG